MGAELRNKTAEDVRLKEEDEAELRNNAEDPPRAASAATTAGDPRILTASSMDVCSPRYSPDTQRMMNSLLREYSDVLCLEDGISLNLAELAAVFHSLSGQAHYTAEHCQKLL